MNKPYILTRRSLNPTAKLLAENLGIRRRFEPKDYPPVIRWGNSEQLYVRDTNYNNQYLIRTCADKYEFDEKMEELDIPHIELHEGYPEKYPIVIRARLFGTRGQGISICESEEDFDENFRNDYWTDWYNFKYELGVHLLGGKITRVFKKVWNGEGEEEKYPIKNAHKGYHFSLVNIENFPSLPTFMNNIYSKFPLEMGRWDIGWDLDNRTYRVIEANSAPGLVENENTLNYYIEFLKGVLNNND